MKRIIALLLAAIMLLSLTGCELDQFMSMFDFQESENTLKPGGNKFPGTDTVPQEPPTTESQLLWDPALYDDLLDEIQEEFGNYAGGCEYLLYDMTDDEIPELILKVGTCEADYEYRIFTIEDGAVSWLGSHNGSHSTLCGYNSGAGLIVHSAHQMHEFISLITLENGLMEVQLILNRPVDNYHTFVTLPTCRLSDRSGLIWNRNPKDSNWMTVSQIIDEESRYQANMLNGFTSAERREINVFLCNFSEQRYQQYPTNYGDLLHFVYVYCYLNKPEVISYQDEFAVIQIDDANNVLKRYFDLYYYPAISYERLIDSYGREIIYERQYMYYPYRLPKEFQGYVTIVDEMIDNGDGTYSVHFVIFSVDEDNYHIASFEPYYTMDIAEAMRYPELKKVAEGEALVKDYYYPGGYHSYQLLQYLEK